MAAIYWFVAHRVHPQTHQLINYPAGIIERFVIGFPGSIEDVMAWVKAQNLGSPGVRYMIDTIDTSRQIKQPVIMAWQISTGAAQMGPSQPMLSSQHLQGGQPYGMPHGRGNEPGGPLDPSSGFETLPGHVVSGVDDGFYAPGDDGTVADLINEGGVVREQKR